MSFGLPGNTGRRRPRIPASESQRRRRLQWLRGILGLVAVAVLALALASLWDRLQRPPADSPEAQLDALYAQLTREVEVRQRAEAERHRAERLLAMKRAEVESFREDIERQEAELAELRDDLAFYQQLADNRVEAPLGIRRFAVQETGHERVVDVVFQVFRPGLNNPVTVHWDLEITGRHAGERDTVALTGSDLGLAEARTLEGVRLLRSVRARVTLPEGFTAERVIVTVEPDDNDDLDGVEERADWDQLMEIGE